MNKRKIGSLCVLTTVALSAVFTLFSGCGLKTSTALGKVRSSSQSSAASSGRVRSFTVEPDWVYASNSLKNLYDSSDFVGEIQVNRAEASLDEYGAISTKFTPSVLKSYKGLYDGSPIVTNGGVMDYSEYKKKLLTASKSFTADSGPIPDQIRCDFGRIPVVERGGSYFLFAQKRGDQYIATNSYEGLYKIDGDTIENNAIYCDTKLLNDIAARTAAQSISHAGQSGGSLTEIIIDKAAFCTAVEKLKNMK